MMTIWNRSQGAIASLSLLVLSAMLLVERSSARAILGVDLGSLYMKVALVQRGAPLEIVTNMHSKRKTENMILFDSGSRFYGADANSLYGRKAVKTPASMTVMLGRDGDHPSVKVFSERAYPHLPTYNETRSGVMLTVDGTDFTPEELVAMLMGHAKDITIAHSASQGTALTVIQDIVLTVPSFATQHERRALLDAAALADLNVLGLLDENTAAALHFGMDKVMEDPKVYIFYNMGANSLQVTVVRYFSYAHKESKYSKETTVGAFEVLGKAWDSTLGGMTFDHRIVEFLIQEFQTQHPTEGESIRSNVRAMAKLRVQAQKVKQVLSANKEIPVYLDSLHKDQSLKSELSRSKFEELCDDLFARATKPIAKALEAANLTSVDEVDGIELIGGGMRVPRVQEEIRTFLDKKLELGMHINSDESMALGASFHGANVSTAFKVRQVGMADISPFAIHIHLSDYEGDGKKKKKKASEEEEAWSKDATMFKAGTKMGVKKTIAFTHDSDILVEIDYEDNEFLPEGTEPALVRYAIEGVKEFHDEMKEKGIEKAPKVSLQFELSTSGITDLLKAEAAVEQTITVEEEVEITDDDEAENKTEADTEEAAADESSTEEDSTEAVPDAEEAKDEETKDGETKTEETAADDEKKDKPKKFKTVEKEKTITHKRSLKPTSFYEGRIRPYSDELMAESKNKLGELARKDKERQLLEEARNRVESYIYKIKNRLSEDEEKIGKVSTEEQRDEIRKLAEEAEEWMYDDGSDADLAVMEAKYAELSTPAEKIWLRVAEMTKRPEAITTLREMLSKVEDLMVKWEKDMPQVTEQERTDVLGKVENIRAWIAQVEEQQEKLESHEEPAFKSTDVPLQTKSLESLLAKLSRKPKPKPKKVPKNATTENENKTAESEDGETTESADDVVDEATEDEKDGGSEAPPLEQDAESVGDEL